MSKLRSLSTGFWSDPFIEDLSAEEKLFYIYLITNEKTNMLGIYELSIRKMSFETGIKKESLETFLKAFEGLGKVKYIENHVVLVNFLKHQNFNTNMKKSAIDIYNSLPNSLKINGLNISKENHLKGFERLSNGLLMLSKIEHELEYEYEEEIEVELEDEESSAKQNLIDSGFLNPFEEDVFYTLEKLENHYKTLDDVHNIVCKKNKIDRQTLFRKLEEFKNHLLSQARQSEKWSEFTKYFNNWLKKNLSSESKEKQLSQTEAIQAHKNQKIVF